MKSKALKSVRDILIVAAGCAAVYVYLKCARPFGIGPWQLYAPFSGIVQTTLLSPYMYAALGITLLFERWIPANPQQKTLSVSFLQDSVWFFYEAVSDVLINVIYLNGLRWVYQMYFSFLTVPGVGDWPYWVRFAAGVLLLDFLYWLQHYINHKVPWFWELHTVHHSQKEINFFTDFRYHMFEYFVRKTFLVLPFLIFAINTPTVVVFSVITTWYTRFYHGNIRTDLGFLRYILVTPQSHRLHHSKLPQHRDLNFGSLFCIWDRIFKTQYYGFDEYPETGIEDTVFPHEQEISPVKALFMPLQQMFYPLTRIAKKIRELFR